MSDEFLPGMVDIYEAMVNWDRRLEREGPFFRQLFERVGASRILDAACGTGHHAALFHSWGLEVEAADISPEMLAAAKKRFGTPDRLRWVLRSFDQPPESGPFDAVVCLGNSLALASDLRQAERAVEAMFTCLRSGGVLIIQLANLWAMAHGQTHWQKCFNYLLEDQELLVLKGIRRIGDRGSVDFVLIDKQASKIIYNHTRIILGIAPFRLCDKLRELRAEKIELFGGYDRQQYRMTESSDLIVVAIKA